MRRTLSAVMVILLLAGIFTSLFSIQPIRGGRPNDSMTSGTLFPYFIDIVILDVNVSLHETVPGPIIHIYVTFEATWDVFDFDSFWVEAYSNSTSIDWQMFIVLWSGHDTFTVDFAWNTSGVEAGSYLISVWTSTMSYYEDGYVRILQTITVPDDFLTIQEAINAANEGDT
ncbi:hypothetical protein KAU25_04485, partial [Candidatus Bathyarchaeota archaeon]|nr:hypothetical protein [Candidatus Bathyarchaeota archaeon]